MNNINSEACKKALVELDYALDLKLDEALLESIGELRNFQTVCFSLTKTFQVAYGNNLEDRLIAPVLEHYWPVH